MPNGTFQHIAASGTTCECATEHTNQLWLYGVLNTSLYCFSADAHSSNFLPCAPGSRIGHHGSGYLTDRYRRKSQAPDGTFEPRKWLVGDITRTDLQPAAYDVWHDRAVFHFLTAPTDRAAYVRQVAQAVKQGGHGIVSTLGLEGPTKGSGLNVIRYDSESLHNEFAVHFRLLGSIKELHQTPFATTQQFLYAERSLRITGGR